MPLKVKGACLQLSSNNSKLVRVREVKTTGDFKRRFEATGARCSSTYASISATCPLSCPYKDRGCYAQHGLTGMVVRRLDEEARGLSSDDVNYNEARLIMGAFKKVPRDGWKRRGRDLRLHVAGDAASAAGAHFLDLAAGEWQRRGGGAVWSYTHAWRTIPREAWGRISTLASVENAEDALSATEMGYAPAIVVDSFYRMTGVIERSRQSYFTSYPHGRGAPSKKPMKFVCCPAETRGVPCVECRLCLDDGKLRHAGVGIAFEAHGAASSQVSQTVSQRKLFPVVRGV